MHRIKFYLIGLLFFIGSTNLLAQEEKKVRLSLTVNPNFTWLTPTNDGYSSEGSKMGSSYGLLMDFRLFGDDNYSLSSGFTFSHLGGKISSPDVVNVNGTNVAARRFSNYSFTGIDVPMVIRLKTNEIGYNVFYGVFGSELGFNINAKDKFTQTYNGNTTEEKTNDISSEVNLFRTSLVVGLGVERKISGNTSYRIGLTYHNGLTNIFKGKSYLADGNGNAQLDSSGNPIEDRDLSTKLKYLELNLSVVF